ncbi:hypothetical protein F5Y19DRAFT_464297 [Xylariaceae sp. FL1651]|nr:hypothetical protein F5Y19DRAFT_464297 [Xylariaceae sp. FL1651]
MVVKDQAYDFIIVGAGAAGCSVASALARSRRRPSVLLLEAGGSNSDPTLRVHDNMFTQFTNGSQNWGYKSAPLVHANNREIPLDRGKGLGGSTAINFTFWLRGPRDEWDEIARVTGDDCWKWKNVERRFRQIENYHHLIEPGTGAERYCAHGPDTYGSAGLLHLSSQSTQWKVDLVETADVWEACGYHLNTDMSTGDHVGLLISPLTGYQGIRSTAADLLQGAPDNLHVKTESEVQRIIILDGKAVGVELLSGKVINCKKEVIVSAGALDTVKILMLSGIGPEDHLNELRIPVAYANKHVGQNLRDHYHVQMHFSVREDATTCLYDSPPTGGSIMGFFKHDKALASSEFQTLPKSEKNRLSYATVPTWEIHHFGPSVRPGLEHMGPTSMINLFVLNSQGLGEVKLRSADRTAPPLVCPRFLEHPWDKRIAIESTRECLRIMDHIASSKSRDPSAKHVCPKSDSEEDILEFWRENLASSWHMTGTCKIGRTQEEDGACLDTDLRVYGVGGLRVADLSVLPFLPSVHTQAYAYQIGMIAAEKIIIEYNLDAEAPLDYR